jgi:predicted Fe-Mo cluster-binding NifX family protein
MKIAVISDDGSTISQHFGRAPYYVVVTVENGKVANKERRDKAGHHTFAGQQGEHHETGGQHGFDAGAQTRHAGMMSNITDSQVLIAGGMGMGAYESLKSRGIETIITDISGIDEAIKLYLEGKLPNLKERLH